MNNCPRHVTKGVMSHPQTKQASFVFALPIDPMQKWLPQNYSFVHMQNSLTNLVRFGVTKSLQFLSQKRG